MLTRWLNTICESRMLVGFLGEKHQAAWWDCSFLSTASTAFLTPVFPNSIALARYTGICQAASILHDSRIGTGKHYHLYRFPDSMEQILFKCIQEPEFAAQISKHLATKETALNRLKELGTAQVNRTEGTVIVGDFSDTQLGDLLKKLLGHYTLAFESGYQIFPYMRNN